MVADFYERVGPEMRYRNTLSDIQSGIFLAKNPAFHSRIKHIQVKYHFIRHLLSDEQLKLEKICGSQNPKNMLTKGVTVEKWSSSLKTKGLSCRDGRWKMEDKMCYICS